MTEPTPAPAPVPAAPADFPGKTLGIVGLVLAILGVFSYGVLSIVGLILSIVAGNQSKAAGFPNQPAKIGVIVGIISLVLGVIAIIVTIALAVAGAAISNAPQI